MDMGNEYAVGWGTLALINAGLAQGKNRSGRFDELDEAFGESGLSESDQVE